MAVRISALTSSWPGVTIGVASIAVVSVVALVRDWDMDSWIWGVAVCVLGAVMSSVAQAGRNRRLDRAVRQARAIGREG